MAPPPRRPRTLSDSKNGSRGGVQIRHRQSAGSRSKDGCHPGVKELVSLRIDQDVLEHFQEGGPGWQDRINAALRKAAGMSRLITPRD